MARYIDANELQHILEKIANEPDYLHDGDTWDTGVNIAGVQVDLMPTADVVEVKHGIWTFARSGRKVVCSCCETPAPFKKNETYHTLWSSGYCPNCGAKMNGEKK